MDQLSGCVLQLQSYINLHRVIEYHLQQQKAALQVLPSVVKLAPGSIQLRLRRPQTWQQSEIQALAAYYHLPEIVCKRTAESLANVQHYFLTLDAVQRRILLKHCQLTDRKLAFRMRLGWSKDQIEALIQGLCRWLATAPSHAVRP